MGAPVVKRSNCRECAYYADRPNYFGFWCCIGRVPIFRQAYTACRHFSALCAIPEPGEGKRP